jgi:hypothetical protein
MTVPLDSDFHLPAALRRRLQTSNYKPLALEIKPLGCEPGSRYVLDWQRELRTHDENGEVSIAPRMALRWITVRKVIRRVDGWLLMFDVTDNRNPSLMLKRGGGYTTDPLHALDRESAVLEPADFDRYALEARMTRVKQSEERAVDERRRQERRMRERLRAILDGLNPQAQTILLARLDVILREYEDVAEAA